MRGISSSSNVRLLWVCACVGEGVAVSKILRTAGSLFWLAVTVGVGLIVLYFVLGFVRRRFSGNVVGRVASGIESLTQP